MTRRANPLFQELLTASLLFFLPAHKAGRLSEAQSRARLEAAVAAIDAAATDAPATAHWPLAAASLLERSRMALEGVPAALNKDVIAEAIDAVLPRFAPSARYAWQDRADIGVHADEAAA